MDLNTNNSHSALNTRFFVILQELNGGDDMNQRGSKLRSYETPQASAERPEP